MFVPSLARIVIGDDCARLGSSYVDIVVQFVQYIRSMRKCAKLWKQNVKLKKSCSVNLKPINWDYDQPIFKMCFVTTE